MNDDNDENDLDLQTIKALLAVSKAARAAGPNYASMADVVTAIGSYRGAHMRMPRILSNLVAARLVERHNNFLPARFSVTVEGTRVLEEAMAKISVLLDDYRRSQW